MAAAVSAGFDAISAGKLGTQRIATLAREVPLQRWLAI
jgi:hypothetical protein